MLDYPQCKEFQIPGEKNRRMKERKQENFLTKMAAYQRLLSKDLFASTVRDTIQRLGNLALKANRSSLHY